MIKKLYIVLSIVMLYIIPIQAKTSTSYLIVSEHIPYCIIADITDTKTTMYMIPTNLVIAKQKNTKDYKIQISSNEDIPTLINQIQTVFHLEIDHYVYLQLQNIEKNLSVPYDETTFSTMHNLTSYFQQVKNAVSLSHIIHYKDYIISDLGISDYYTLFHLFKNNNVSIQYAYINHIIIDNDKIPLDTSFYIK